MERGGKRERDASNVVPNERERAGLLQGVQVIPMEREREREREREQDCKLPCSRVSRVIPMERERAGL